MSLGYMPEKKRKGLESLIRSIAAEAACDLSEHGDEEFFAESRGMAMGLARAALAFGYEKDWNELRELVDELFRQ